MPRHDLSLSSLHSPTKTLWFRALLLGLGLFLSASGCTKKLDLARVDQAKPADSAAKKEWEAARAAFEQNPQTSGGAFESFIAAHPKDPLVPAAYLFLSRARLASHDYSRAKEAAEQALALAPSKNGDIARAARYLSAAAKVGLGESAEALPVLAEFRDKFSDPAENARAALLLAEAAADLKETRRALVAFSEAYERSENPTDKLYAKLRAQALVPLLSSEDLRSLYDASEKDSLAAAVIAPRLAKELVFQGEEAKATDILSETRAARLVILGTDAVDGLTISGADARAIGAVLPLTGKTARIGRLFLRGLFFAAEGAARPGEKPPFRLVIRDSGSTAEGARAAVEELVKIEGVIGLIGPSDPEEARAAAKAAAALETPMLSLSLDPAVTEQGESIFWASVDNDLQARSLARYAVSKARLSKVAVLSPDTPYGKSMATAFLEEAKSLGASVVAQETYPSGASSWDKQVKNLVRAKPQAIFIPDGPKALSGIAPALAAAGLWSRPVGQKAPRGNPVQLLAPNPAISLKLISDAGSTVEGAVFATEFFPEDPRVSAFRRDFSLREGESPTFFDAASYEAFLFLAEAISSGAVSRSALRQALAESSFSSLTGKVSFGSDRRADRTLTLVQVVGSRFEVLK